MSGFDEFYRAVTGAYSEDYWADDVSSYAKELLHQFTLDEWAVARSSWREFPRLGQVRFADVLSAAVPRHAAPILVEMIQATDGEVQEAAAESLRCLGDGSSPILVDPAVIDQVNELSQRATGIFAKTLPLLLQRLRAL